MSIFVMSNKFMSTWTTKTYFNISSFWPDQITDVVLIWVLVIDVFIDQLLTII